MHWSAHICVRAVEFKDVTIRFTCLAIFVARAELVELRATVEPFERGGTCRRWRSLKKLTSPSKKTREHQKKKQWSDNGTHVAQLQFQERYDSQGECNSPKKRTTLNACIWRNLKRKRLAWASESSSEVHGGYSGGRVQSPK